MVIISFLLICVGVALLPHLVYLIAKAISHFTHHPIAYKPFGYTALGMIGVWLVLFCWGYFFGRYFHEVKSVTITCKGLLRLMTASVLFRYPTFTLMAGKAMRTSFSVSSMR